VPVERISKIIASAGLASRRGADALIAAGRVTVDGQTVGLGATADPKDARIAVDGRPIEPQAAATHARTYLALNKPIGVTSTVRDRHATRTVIDLVPAALRPPGGRLFPVGRLDRDSEGLILLTDDGQWAQRITHPSYEVEREYLVGLRAWLEPHQAAELRHGVALDEGLARFGEFRPAAMGDVRDLARIVDPPFPTQTVWYAATLGQGWRRQIRRMLGAVGVPVVRLVRIRIGPLELNGLATGAVRALRPDEAAAFVDEAPG
jgi:23S rRNA pseudouridine2605 synthase